MIKFLKIAKLEILIALLLVLVGFSFYAKFNELAFMDSFIAVLILSALYIYFAYLLKVKFCLFLKGVIGLFFLYFLVTMGNESNLYMVNDFVLYLPQFIMLLAYFGLTYYGALRLKKIKIKEASNIYAIVVLLINIVLAIVFLKIIVANIHDALLRYIIFTYGFVLISLGFVSFLAYIYDGLNQSFIFILMALSFICGDIFYVLNRFLVKNIVFDMGDILATTFGVYCMFLFVYKKQVKEQFEELNVQAPLENDVNDFAIRL